MTHEVLNQPPPLENYNAYLTDAALVEGIRREQAGWAHIDLQTFGERSGSAEVIRWGFDANENPPVLHTHDRYGNRRDEVIFHPSYHRLMDLSITAGGIHSKPWQDPRPGAHVSRIAHAYLISQAEGAHVCPVSMTYSSIPALRKQPEVAREWDAFITGLLEIAEKQREGKSPEEFERIWDWIPAGARRSINDTLRHIAYVEYYIIDRVIMDREPKTILPGSMFPRDEYPTFSACMRLLHDVHDGTKIAYRHIKPADLKKEIPASDSLKSH